MAITAVVRLILLGTVFSLKQEMVAEAGGCDGVKLKVLSRPYRAGEGLAPSLRQERHVQNCGTALSVRVEWDEP